MVQSSLRRGSDMVVVVVLEMRSGKNYALIVDN
jgi:hypothetical protein